MKDIIVLMIIISGVLSLSIEMEDSIKPKYSLNQLAEILFNKHFFSFCSILIKFAKMKRFDLIE